MYEVAIEYGAEAVGLADKLNPKDIAKGYVINNSDNIDWSNVNSSIRENNRNDTSALTDKRALRTV